MRRRLSEIAHMSIIGLILILALIGFLVWAITSLIPMDGRIKNLIVIVALIVCVLVVLNAFGLLDGLKSVSVPRIR